MILLDIYEQREPYQKAIDALEQRRIDDLKEKMSYLEKAFAKADTDELRAAIKRRYEEYKSELIGYHSVRDTNEAEQPQQPPAKGLLKGKDLVTPQQRVAGATPQKPGIVGAVKDVAGGVKRWIKGEPDQGPTYEQEEPQQDTSTPARPEFQIMAELVAAWKGELDYLELPLLDGSSVPITRPAMYNAIVAFMNIRNNRPKKYIAYLQQHLADKHSFLSWLANVPRYRTPAKKKKQTQKGLQLTPPPVQSTGAEPTPNAPSGPMFDPEFKKDVGLSERQIQKKKSKEAPIRDVQLARAVQQARAKFPTAVSDIEAFAKDEIEKQTQAEKRIKDLQAVNDRQDAALRRSMSLDTEQGEEIDSLEQKLQQISQRLQSIKTAKPAGAVAPKAGATVNIQPSTTVQPTAVPVAEPVAQEPVSTAVAKKTKTATKKATTRKPRVKKMPAKDMGPVVPASQEPGQPQLPQPELFRPDDIDIDRLLTDKDLAALADLETTKAIKKAKAPRKQKAAVEEHGGGIGPRQHWQSLMREGAIKSAMYDYKIVSDEEFLRSYGMTKRQFYDTVVNPRKTIKKSAYKAPASCPQCGRAHEQCICEGTAKQFGQAVRMAGYTGRELEKDTAEKFDRKIAGFEKQQSLKNLQRVKQGYQDDNDESDWRDIDESIKDTASATAVIACLLTGGSLSGCATAPQQTSAQQVLRTGQDIGRTIKTAKNITKADVEAEVNQEIRNLLRGVSGRPEELNHSNILRIWRMVKGQPPVSPEPQAPEYGPAEPVKRPATFEGKEILTKDDFLDARDYLFRKINAESNPVNKQILKAEVRKLENRAEQQGWLTPEQRLIREDTVALAAEDAILKRIFVKHRDLMMEYGTDKITQAAESVAYNVGDIAHITDEQINEWVGQVEYILGARP